MRSGLFYAFTAIRSAGGGSGWASPSALRKLIHEAGLRRHFILIDAKPVDDYVSQQSPDFVFINLLIWMLRSHGVQHFLIEVIDA